MAPWRSGYAEVCKTFYTGSIPVGASKNWASGGIGIRGGLKIRCQQWLESSSLSSPTKAMVRLARAIALRGERELFEFVGARRAAKCELDHIWRAPAKVA